MSKPLLEIASLTCVLGDRNILEDLSLTIEEGEIHALLGANGSGKSTLAYLIMGCEGYKPSKGKILFSGADLAPLKIHERARLGITLSWQEPARFEGLPVRQYLALGQSSIDSADTLELVGLPPARYLDRLVDKSLSGGERHRIELASVLSVKPKLAILDEPASGIDMLSLNQIIQVIRTLRSAGGSVLLITHRDEVARIADRASQLCGGKIIFSGDPQSVAEHYRGETCVRCDGEVCANERP